MLWDIGCAGTDEQVKPVHTYCEDARSLPLRSDSVDAVLTSPPYPNRHDYSRVFHIELLLLEYQKPRSNRCVTNL